MIRITAWAVGLAGAVLQCAACATDYDAAHQSAASLVAKAIQYEHGEGIQRNVARAADLYCAAVRLGSPDAAYHLGWMYANRRGFERDDGYAVALFQRAAAQGHEDAQRMLARIRSDEVRLPDCVTAPISALLAKTDLADRVRAESTIAELARLEKLAQAERTKGDALRAELAKAEQGLSSERARSQTAIVELAKIEKLVSAERANAEAVRIALARAQPKGAGAGSNAHSEQNEISTALANWADAWSRKDVDAYFAAYARDFVSTGGQSQRQWERERRERIVGKAWIAVKIRDLEISVEGALARAHFMQDYRSDRLSESGTKMLTLVKRDRNWLIRQEQSEQ